MLFVSISSAVTGGFVNSTVLLLGAAVLALGIRSYRAASFGIAYQWTATEEPEEAPTEAVTSGTEEHPAPNTYEAPGCQETDYP